MLRRCMGFARGKDGIGTPLPPAQVGPTLHAVTTPVISRVWIEEGCISCKLCQDIAPNVFLVEDDQTCVVKADAGTHFTKQAEDIRQAAKDCPVEVIKVEG